MKNIFHFHKFEPILSAYISFNFRRVVYKCKCGKIKWKDVLQEKIYPFPTSDYISKEEANKICNGQIKINRITNNTVLLEKLENS